MTNSQPKRTRKLFRMNILQRSELATPKADGTGQHQRGQMETGGKWLRKGDKDFPEVPIRKTKENVNKLLADFYLCGKMKDSNRSARAFSSEATTRKMSLIESMPRKPCFSSSTIK